MTAPAPQEPWALLRAAADRVEALAGAATPGPWVQAWDEPQMVLAPTEPGSHAVDKQLAEAWLDEDAEWIAAMSPAVAGPLVAWLRAEAAAHLAERYSWPPLGADGDPALEFARAVLGVEVTS